VQKHLNTEKKGKEVREGKVVNGDPSLERKKKLKSRQLARIERGGVLGKKGGTGGTPA